MGLSITQDSFDDADHSRFTQRLQQSLHVLQELLNSPGFGEGSVTLGAELELSIIDKAGKAYPINRSLLTQSLDDCIQLELNRFNLEYNLSPVSLCGTPFSSLESQLHYAIDALNEMALTQGGRVVPIGILPTLSPEDLQSSAMSDLPRYRALSAGIRKMRDRPFVIQINGDDPLTTVCDDVTLEGANTSFQIHLRVAPKDFTRIYNSAQVVTPIAVALGANSPLFLGHRLWDETRVALFKQAIDSRSIEEREWHRPARVSFGHGWLRTGALELFAEAVGLFQPLLPVLSDEDPWQSFSAGTLPRLEELRLHQGTVWRWNRAVYDPAMGGHLRIEFRALPAGPTPVDMVANAAFLIGMTLGLSRQVEAFLPFFPFDYAHHNFYRAAQHGLDAILLWPTAAPPSPQEVSLCDLATELLPVAEEGLSEFGVEKDEINRMLGVIRERIKHRVTGARWQRSVLNQLETSLPRPAALHQLLETYVRELHQSRPVTEWSTRP